MAAWDSAQYLKFGDERTRAVRDLVARVRLAKVGRAIDLGCGPGNSTAVLRERWPDATINAIDSSPEMIAAAKASGLRATFAEADIAAWADADGEADDLVFSNAAFQWVDDATTVLAKCMRRVAPGGALAIQVPYNTDAPAQRAMRELLAKRAHRLVGGIHWHATTPQAIYDALAPHATSIDLWTTTYYHVLPSSDAIIEFYKGTALRPILAALADDAARRDYLAELGERLRREYPASVDAKVLFAFDRLFVVALP